MSVRLQWTERKKDDDYETGYGIGPRFHPRFSNSKIISQTDRLITLEKIVLNDIIAADQVHHISSWDGNFGIKTESINERDGTHDDIAIVESEVKQKRKDKKDQHSYGNDRMKEVAGY